MRKFIEWHWINFVQFFVKFPARKECLRSKLLANRMQWFCHAVIWKNKLRFILKLIPDNSLYTVSFFHLNARLLEIYFKLNFWQLSLYCFLVSFQYYLKPSRLRRSMCVSMNTILNSMIEIVIIRLILLMLCTS